MNLVEQLVELAQEVETNDPIDWGMLAIDERDAYRLIATSVLEQFGPPQTEREWLLIATVTKLVVENFVLNLKFLGSPPR